MIDYLIVGSGLFGSIFAYEMNKRGYKVLVLEKRNHIGGNIYTYEQNGINVHKYGAHIFHTNNKEVWDYINQFGEFNRFTNSPVANYKGEIYSLPFNMYTFNKLWKDCITPNDALRHIDNERNEIIDEPKNLEEQAIKLVGRTVYEKLIKEYTEKQWGRDCKNLPPSIIKRLPVRLKYDNNYFNAKYQGIPVDGYTKLIEKMLNGIEVKLNTNYNDNKEYWNSLSNNIIYTGPIDEFYDYCFGKLEYRTVKFQNECLHIENYQGNAVVNYTSKEVPYTRIIEHKWFDIDNDSKYTIISKEYSKEWEEGDEPYYPINDTKNDELYKKYRSIQNQKNVIFGGRLAEYKYFDMDKTIESVLNLIKSIV